MVKEIKFDNLKSVMKQIIDGSYLRASILGIQRVIHVSVTNLNNVPRKANESRSPSERAVWSEFSQSWLPEYPRLSVIVPYKNLDSNKDWSFGNCDLNECTLSKLQVEKKKANTRYKM